MERRNRRSAAAAVWLIDNQGSRVRLVKTVSKTWLVCMEWILSSMWILYFGGCGSYISYILENRGKETLCPNPSDVFEASWSQCLSQARRVMGKHSFSIPFRPNDVMRPKHCFMEMLHWYCACFDMCCRGSGKAVCFTTS